MALNFATSKLERYQWVQKTLVKHQYLQLGKADKGILARYLMKVTGYSLVQTKRLIQQQRKTGRVSIRTTTKNGFTRRYRDAGILFLAAMDERHQQSSGAVLKSSVNALTNGLVKQTINGAAQKIYQ